MKIDKIQIKMNRLGLDGVINCLKNIYEIIFRVVCF